MSAAAKISQGQPPEGPSEDNEEPIHFDEASKATLCSQLEKTVPSPFIEEAREEPFDEIKEDACKDDFVLNYSSKSENYYGENIENKPQCNKRGRLVSSNENDPVDDQSQILTRWSANQENNETNIMPALIQTSCLNQEEIDFILQSLLQIFYNNSELSQNIDNTPTFTKQELKFLNSNPENLESLKTQMSLKLKNGHGEARYIIGVMNNTDDAGLDKADMYQSLRNLCRIASSLEADILVLQMEDGTLGKIAHVLVRATIRDNVSPDIKVILLGDTKSGKSTLVGALASKQLDDGNGLLRTSLHNHKHEIISGETSTLIPHMLGFEDNGNMSSFKRSEQNTWENIVRSGAKVLTLFDIGGSEKTKHKIASRLSSLQPDYAFLVISAIQGVTGTTEDHLRLALLSEIQVIIIITHTDLVMENCLFDIRSQVEALIRKFSSDHYLLVAENEEDNLILSRTIKQRIAIPLFKVSSVNGQNLSLFQNFLSLLPFNTILNTNQPSEFHAYKTFHKDDKVILAGVVHKGQIKKHQVLLFGPDIEGNFSYAEVLNIRNKNVDVRQSYAGQICTVEIKVSKFAKNKLDTEKSSFKKGMVLIDPKSKPESCMSFVAEILSPEDKTEDIIISEHYEPVVVAHSIRQSCSLELGSSEEIKKNDLCTENKENSCTQLNNTKTFSTPDQPPQELLKCGKSTKLNPIQSKLIRGQKWVKKSQQKPNTACLKKNNQMQIFFKKQNDGKKDKCKRKETLELCSKNNSKTLKIQPGETRLMIFRFKFRPEYLVEGQRIVIDDSYLKCVGIVRKVLYKTPRTST